MNILIIPSWYPSKSQPLTGSFFREQALALSKTDNNVIVLNASFSSRKSYFDSNNFRFLKTMDEGLKVYSFGIPSFGIYRNKKLYCNIYKIIMFHLFSKIRKDFGSIDVIHAHSCIPAGIAACELGRKYGIPVVVTEHSSGIIRRTIGSAEQEYIKQTVKMSDKFLCVSNALKEAVLNMADLNKDIEVLPNIVSPLFSYSNDKNKNDFYTFVSVGNLVNLKRHDLTISAFTEAFRGKAARLQIIGDGVLHTELQKQINESGMSGQIELTGALSREETARRIKQSDAFVLASDSETFGIAYIEALACGKPVIGTRNGGAQDIIDDKNGIIVDAGNLKQLSEAMEYVFCNAGEFDSYEISQQCIDKYSVGKITDRLLRIYNEALLPDQNE